MLLGILLLSRQFSTTGLSPSLVQYLAASSNRVDSILQSHYPKVHVLWFRLFPFRSPLLRESRLISFPSATKMFQFAELALSRLYIQRVVYRVAPFGNFWINACFQLPRTYRR
jgi:hypothetical protein